ncbi:GNAT family N-acetyltransferase [Streptomyces sp. NPDC047085]|uniref:GNAT family N-acetyltransferase n=1 Tax=Streptomyces sp. NPDC047085 TaxID=3155140 RepID=UPI0033CC89BE
MRAGPSGARRRSHDRAARGSTFRGFVRPPWQSQGIGTRLHTALLQAVNPRWSSLLALPSNQRGQDLYARLGYKYADPYRNTPDGPEFDLLLVHVRDAT